MINPTITKADTFASAIPSTLFPAYAKIIIAATTLSIVANMDMINVVHNDISDTEPVSYTHLTLPTILRV